MIPLNLDNKILNFPVFRSQNSQEVTWCIFEIVTAVVHLGRSDRPVITELLPFCIGK